MERVRDGLLGIASGASPSDASVLAVYKSRRRSHSASNVPAFAARTWSRHSLSSTAASADSMSLWPDPSTWPTKRIRRRRADSFVNWPRMAAAGGTKACRANLKPVREAAGRAG